MNRSKLLAGVLAALVAISMAGCETTGESAGLGALIGAGAGALIGSTTGNAGEGALIGAVVGGVAGAIGHDVQQTRAEKRRTAEATYQEYNYQPSQGESLAFENSSVEPTIVRRGSMVEATMQYAILGTGAGRSLTETRIIKQGDTIISQVSSRTFTRNDGTWVSAQEFRIPDNWDPGEYTLEQVVATELSVISGTAKLIVE